MEAEVKEWLEHLDELLIKIIHILADEHRHGRTEGALLAALVNYRGQMENL